MAEKRHDGLGDLHETVEEAREELAVERGIEPEEGEAEPTPEEFVEPVASKKPRYTKEGVLLNPEDFDVSPEGMLKPKG